MASQNLAHSKQSLSIFYYCPKCMHLLFIPENTAKSQQKLTKMHRYELAFQDITVRIAKKSKQKAELSLSYERAVFVFDTQVIFSILSRMRKANILQNRYRSAARSGAFRQTADSLTKPDDCFLSISDAIGAQGVRKEVVTF